MSNPNAPRAPKGAEGGHGGEFVEQNGQNPSGAVSAALAANAAQSKPLPDVHYDVMLAHYGDSVIAEQRALDSKVYAFIADAREYVPEAVGARFYPEYNDETGREQKVFDCYIDKDGQPINEDGNDLPDLNTFDVTSAWMPGYETDQTNDFGEEINGVLHFGKVTLPDENAVRLEATLGAKLRGRDNSDRLRPFLMEAFAGGVPAEYADQLDEAHFAMAEAMLRKAAAELRAHFNVDFAAKNA